jgi:hypothetical protein
MTERLKEHSWAAALVAVLLALGSLGISVVQTTTDDGQGTTQKRTDVTFKVNEEAGDGKPTTTLEVPKKTAVEVQSQVVDKHLRDETPAVAEQVVPEDLEAAQEYVEDLKVEQVPLPTAGASQGFVGCRTYFVRNQSSRNGVRPQLQVLHYTVSKNVMGWGDVLSIVRYFDRADVGASSHFIIDAEGNCAYTVPIERKAWTQAAANPYSISYEIINYGNEAVFMSPAGYAKLRSVMIQVSNRTGIPMQTAALNGCVPVKGGTTQHAAFGYCGGGHHDIGPFPFASIAAQLHKQQPVTKKVKWIQHRSKVSRIYKKKCGTPEQRRVTNRGSCAKLRSTARKLDKLIARKA